MASKHERQKRKALIRQVKHDEQVRAEEQLPLPRPVIKALFDYVNARLEKEGCDHALRYTRAFLDEHELPPAPVIAWLAGQGGYCDCEVIANVEEAWGDAVGSI
jgi:hypothetical protein